jgi:hypothetical protein
VKTTWEPSRQASIKSDYGKTNYDHLPLPGGRKVAECNNAESANALIGVGSKGSLTKTAAARILSCRQSRSLQLKRKPATLPYSSCSRTARNDAKTGNSGRKAFLRPLIATSPPVPAVVMTPIPAVARVIGVGTIIVGPPPATIGTADPTHLLHICIFGRCDRRNRRRESCGSDNRTAQHGSA